MMAEHPAEVEEITVTAGALALNLGNITDARRTSILVAGKAAMEHRIPVILDMVGIGCSHFRKEITEEFLRRRIPGAPLVLKGNMSELKALAGGSFGVSGVDADPKDVLSESNQAEAVRLAKATAKAYGAVVLASGKTDLITDGGQVCLIDNGCEMMGRITGTGCMLNVLTGTYMSAGNPMAAARQGLFFLPLIFILPTFLGLRGVEMCQMVSDILTFLLAMPLSISVLNKMGVKKD